MSIPPDRIDALIIAGTIIVLTIAVLRLRRLQ